MVFLLQRSQTHGVRAVQVKLNELVRAVTRARNKIINLETSRRRNWRDSRRSSGALHLEYAAELPEKATATVGAPAAGPVPKK
jgi:low affinity Fe/Cu permease